MNPDGYLVVYLADNSQVTYPFAETYGWRMSDRRCYESDYVPVLIIRTEDGRIEYPLSHIKCVEVHNNSTEYLNWKRQELPQGEKEQGVA